MEAFHWKVNLSDGVFSSLWTCHMAHMISRLKGHQGGRFELKLILWFWWKCVLIKMQFGYFDFLNSQYNTFVFLVWNRFLPSRPILSNLRFLPTMISSIAWKSLAFTNLFSPFESAFNFPENIVFFWSPAHEISRPFWILFEQSFFIFVILGNCFEKDLLIEFFLKLLNAYATSFKIRVLSVLQLQLWNKILELCESISS